MVEGELFSQVVMIVLTTGLNLGLLDMIEFEIRILACGARGRVLMTKSTLEEGRFSSSIDRKLAKLRRQLSLRCELIDALWNKFWG